MSPAERFGRNLLVARRQAGLTQGQLGRQASMYQNDVSLFERGQRCPRLDTVVRLAGVLEMPVTDLLRGIG
jgi:transcriptional regulator with XRE-family HTH domain